MAVLFQATQEVNGINNTIDLTMGHIPTNIIGTSTGTMFPALIILFLS